MPIVEFTIVEFNRELLFGTGYYENIYLSSGFSSPEINHVWTNREEAKIKIPINEANFDLKLTITGGKLSILQSVDLIVNECIYGKLEDGGNVFIIKTDELVNQEYLNIKIITSKVYSPKELGINDDERTLGFGLVAIGLYEYNQED